MVTLKQIIDSKEILGIYIQYLVKNPADFIALVNTDPSLAKTYAEKFSAGHVLTLLATAQEKNRNLITEMINISPKIAMRDYQVQKFALPSTNEAIIELYKTMAPKIRISHNNNYAAPGYIFYYGEEQVTTIFNKVHSSTPDRNLSYAGSSTTYESHTIDKGILTIQLKSNQGGTWNIYNHEMFINVYHNTVAKARRIQDECAAAKQSISEIANILLSKLDHTVTLSDKNNECHGVMDPEFKEITPAATRSWFFRRGNPTTPPAPTTGLIHELLDRKCFDLIGKIITLLSPNLAMRELQKTYLDNKQLLALLINQTNQHPLITVALIKQMQAMPTPYFEEVMLDFHFDVLGAIKQKDKDMAEAFYNISTGFMQNQYPDSVAEYTGQHWEDPDKESRKDGLYPL